MKRHFLSESNPMEYRISMIFLMVALFASILSATTNTLLNKGLWGILFQWTFIALMLAFMFAPSRFQLHLFRPLVVLTTFVYIPFLFTQTAGYDGTALMFSLLCIFVISVAFEKKTRIILIVLNVVLLFSLCLLAFFHPQWIVPHAGAPAKLLDQLVALVVTVFAMAILSIYIIDALKKGIRHNQRLLSELEQKNRNLAKLSYIFINLRPDEASMKKSMDLAGAFLGCDALMFLKKSPSGDILTQRYAWQLQEEAPCVADANFSVEMSTYDALFTGGSLFMTHTDKSGAHLTIPITFDNNAWGVAIYTHRKQSTWGDSDIQLAVLLTSVFTSYFERRSYEGSIERQLKQQSLTSNISGRFINIDGLASRVTDSIQDIGHFLCCDGIFIYRRENGAMTFAQRYAWTSGTDMPPWDIARCTQDIYDVFHAQNKPYLICTPSGTDADIPASTLLVPLHINGDLGGVLALIFYQPHHWRESEIQLCLMFGATYSVVLERDLQEKRLMEAKQQAEAASKVKSEFLSNMSHEIRTPLNAITGMTEIGLAADGANDDKGKARECLRNIRTASSQLLAIINDILDISKIESGKLVLELAPFHFGQMLHAVEGMMCEQAEKKKQTLVVRLEDELDSFYMGDETRIAQIITNLLSNAVKFTPEGGHISLEAQRFLWKNMCPAVRVSITDTGIGVSPQQLKNIFHSFEQADNSITRRYGGTGLGLAIVKNLVEKMDGHVRVASTLGKGSTFTFEIPLPPADARTPPKDAAASLDAGPTNSFANLCILLAEDIEINRVVFEELLSSTGIRIDSVCNGLEALQAFADAPERYDLIFMDIQMPVMDGLEATRAIRVLDTNRAKTIPILAMTANVFKEDIQRSQEAGMNDHLGKPINIEEVYDKIARYTKPSCIGAPKPNSALNI